MNLQIPGSVEPKGNFGGAGGKGKMGTERQSGGRRGGTGSIIISW
jgi:hypothetical protein